MECLDIYTQPEEFMLDDDLSELAELDLFAEELPERLSNNAVPMKSASTLSTASTVGGCVGSLSSLACW